MDKNINNEINSLRQELQKAIDSQDLTSDSILDISMRLDLLIVEFMKIEADKNCNKVCT